MLTFPIFRDENSFSSRNILKTADDFQSLQNVPLSLENTGAIEGILLYSGSDLFLILLLIVVALCFLAERKRELWGLVYSLQMGRSSLALHRLGILLFLSVTGTLFALRKQCSSWNNSLRWYWKSSYQCSVYPYLTGVSRSDFHWWFFDPIYSSPNWICFPVGAYTLAFIRSTFRCTLRSGYWYCVSIDRIRTLSLSPGTKRLQHFEIFKSLHIFSYSSPLYTLSQCGYSGISVGIRRVSELATLPLIFVTSSGCIAQQCFRRPAQGKSWVEIFTRRIGNCLDRCLQYLPLWGREVYKILFSQRGIVILLLFVYLALGIEHSVPLQAGSEQVAYERQYFVQLQGEITSKTFSEIDQLQEEQKKLLRQWDRQRKHTLTVKFRAVNICQ